MDAGDGDRGRRRHRAHRPHRSYRISGAWANPLTSPVPAAFHLQAVRRGRPRRSRQRRPLGRQARRHRRDHRPQPCADRRPHHLGPPPADPLPQPHPHPLHPRFPAPRGRLGPHQEGHREGRCDGEVGAVRLGQEARREAGSQGESGVLALATLSFRLSTSAPARRRRLLLPVAVC